MNSFTWVADAAPLPGFLIRVTVVLATGLVFAWLIRKRSAQVRHRLWTATMLLLLLLPALSFWAPQWDVPLLPAPSGTGVEVETTDLPAPFAAWTPVSSANVPEAEPARGHEAGLAAERVLRPASGHGREPASADNGESAVGSGAGSATGRSARPARPLVLWAIGCLVGLISLAAGHLRFRTLVRGARPLADPRWIRDLRAAGSRLGLRGDVRLLVSDTAGTPMTGGFWRPVILLPASSVTWDSARRTVVLMHELVHVRRRDALRQLMGGVVLALYWFHPLSWLAFRLAATSREEACDERVLELGSRPSEYARHLVSLATGTRTDRLPVAALSMARQSPSRLEKRIMAILRPRRPRPSALATTALVAAIAALAVSVAVTHPVQRESADALAILADPPVGLPDAKVGLEDTPVGEAVDEQARGAAVTPAEGPSEAPGSGPPMSNPGDPADDPADGSGERGVEAGAAGSHGEPAMENGTPPVTEPGGGTESLAGTPATVSPDAPFQDAPPLRDLPDIDCDTLPQGVGNASGVGTTRSSPDSPPRDVVRVVMETVDGVRLCMRIRTDAVLEGGELRSLAPDDWILLESEGDRVHRLIIRNVNGGFEHWWSVGGENRPFDDQAREWRDGMLAVLGGHLEIGRIRREVSDLQEQISHHRAVVAGLQGQAAHERDVVASLQGQVSYYQGVVAGLLDQITYHQGVVAAMRDDIAYHRSIVSGLRDGITYHRARVAALQEVKSSYEAQITAIVPRLKTADARTRHSIEASIRGLEERIKETEEQIEAYGLGGKVANINAEIREYSLDAKVRNLEQRIQAYELQAGLQKIEAEIEEQSKRLDDVTRRAEEALRAREARSGEVEREVDAYYLDHKVARLEQRIRELGADEAVARIEQSIEEARRQLLELIGRL
ncbi:MAG: hypothetical protein F4087_11400 [Gemmatimonadetes bacterium]|nr:hypothetical protein [Gemmatimonadota bacterium]MYE70498.1 hypothetical protein [Gemmatimonadota bacterium]MYJ69100.1 hypothetical protein [Gemmatimonadota bacterium]